MWVHPHGSWRGMGIAGAAWAGVSSWLVLGGLAACPYGRGSCDMGPTVRHLVPSSLIGIGWSSRALQIPEVSRETWRFDAGASACFPGRGRRGRSAHGCSSSLGSSEGAWRQARRERTGGRIRGAASFPSRRQGVSREAQLSGVDVPRETSVDPVVLGCARRRP